MSAFMRLLLHHGQQQRRILACGAGAQVHNVRKAFVEVLKEKFKDYNLTFSIGGQISFDAFPRGWDKTFCLQFVENEFSEIHFFGDKAYPGGNDHEIFESEKTIGHTVTSPEDSMKQCTEIFLSS